MLKARRYFLVFLLMFCIIDVSRAQKNMIVDARWQLELSGGYSFPMGPKVSNGKVNLLSNMDSGPSYNLRYMRYLRKKLSLGVWAGVAQFDNWSSPASSLYDGTSARFLFAGPSVMYKAWPTRRKANISLLLSPGISQVYIRTSTDSEINGRPTTVALSVNSMRFTIAANTCMHYLFSDSFGLMLIAGYQRTFADSEIFTEKNFDFLSVQAGLLLRISKNKRYKYRDL